ncbi:MAG: hypothetical protein AAF526_07000 [Pseudomonadota bacterium]
MSARERSKTSAIFAAALFAAIFSAPQSIADEQRPTLPELQRKLGEALRSLSDNLAPVIEDMTESFGILEQIDDIENYSPPEMLPNGDIIIRRHPEAPPYTAPEDPDAEQAPGVKT